MGVSWCVQKTCPLLLRIISHTMSHMSHKYDLYNWRSLLSLYGVCCHIINMMCVIYPCHMLAACFLFLLCHTFPAMSHLSCHVTFFLLYHTFSCHVTLSVMSHFCHVTLVTPCHILAVGPVPNKWYENCNEIAQKYCPRQPMKYSNEIPKISP